MSSALRVRLGVACLLVVLGCGAAACFTVPKVLEPSLANDDRTGEPHTIGQRLITAEHTVTVDAPAADVWRVLSDSSLAIQWSVYFHHIEPLEGKDGALGAVRRCFRTPDERGISWDERVVELVPERVRRMKVFRLRGMALESMDESEFEVWQVLEPVSPTQTKLTFRTTPWHGRPVNEGLSFTFGRASVERVFRLNLENMKALIEEGAAYERLHPYEPLRADEERAAARVEGAAGAP